MADECTLMQIVEHGWVQADGSIDWTERSQYQVPASNRTRILKRDSEYPTGPDGWKIVPASHSVPGYMARIMWEDLRAYAPEHRTAS
ncbi:hypothetical protein [Prescottella agglutinans]|uniref:Uncharacterized protein n=1 Tax=Prescottella agglutinans TaxID=1644129 RepID=A0ABT6MEU3_9NOCA|nr:hypothetical protein [Prescottella agglutinans]MDH6282841.1 hypothetical protein [Prescottella agglutinans]